MSVDKCDRCNNTSMAECRYCNYHNPKVTAEGDCDNCKTMFYMNDLYRPKSGVNKYYCFSCSKELGEYPY